MGERTWKRLGLKIVSKSWHVAGDNCTFHREPFRCDAVDLSSLVYNMAVRAVTRKIRACHQGFIACLHAETMNLALRDLALLARHNRFEQDFASAMVG